MISIQVPHFSNPLPNYFSMHEQTSYSNGIPSTYSTALSKPQSHDTYASTASSSSTTTNGHHHHQSTANGTSDQHHSQQNGLPPQKSKPNGVPGAKRRASRAGTRSVSTLTAAQLERKRANDREAQRAIRQRTKDHIESLERRIAELTSSSDINAKLLQALQRNEELEKENSILRSRLNHAVAMAEGGALNPDILTNPASPNRHPLKLTTHPVRASSTPASAPRSVPTPTSAAPPLPQDSWTTAYHSPISTTTTGGIERSPPLADVSPVSTGGMRWGAPAHTHSPVVSEAPEQRGLPGAPDGYANYLVDSAGRALPYSPAATEHPSMYVTGPPPPTSEPAHAYHGAQLATPTAASATGSPAAYHGTYPGTPGPFGMPTGSPHESGPEGMGYRGGPMDAPPSLMYGMQQGVKVDDH